MNLIHKSWQVVDFDSFLSCAKDVLIPCFEMVFRILDDAHPTFIFGGEESSLEPSFEKKKLLFELRERVML